MVGTHAADVDGPGGDAEIGGRGEQPLLGQEDGLSPSSPATEAARRRLRVRRHGHARRCRSRARSTAVARASHEAFHVKLSIDRAVA